MREIIAVVGLGYVGLPVAVALSRKYETLGFDIDARRVAELKSGVDRTNEISSNELKETKPNFTDRAEDIRHASFYIVTVPTPIDEAHRPDLDAVVSATKAIAGMLKKNDLVVYESTVYPGLTEEICVPLLESISSLKFNLDFFVGYSPERINPGDKERTFTKIKKIVSASTPEALARVTAVYGSVVEPGVFSASSIKVAEAAKVIENTQRDLNVALINELALIFHRLNIDTLEVLEAAGSKWNFLPFRPGLVGGHCIGVDPYYLTHKAEQVGYYPDVILAGRRVNDAMGRYIADETVRLLAQGDRPINKCKVGVLGVTFKENCPDIRNSRVFDLIQELAVWGCEIIAVDPWADADEVHAEHGVKLSKLENLKDMDALIFSVAHHQFKSLTARQISDMYSTQKVLLDVKSFLDRKALAAEQIKTWRL